ncbi:cytochrome c oxidase assembly factor Coa1 family protein [Flavobacterium poyangense]|uniref:cytochrome c oxidase assembly factor Coa1 family protein n=1 Tax=Flavobacterium poyangense TaxID=2204302 RepID=UPI00141FBE76|nr:cytochrome c oxidase assembly factor Coa1 family protein [Flavobacterium sp. JXAS1]
MNNDLIEKESWFKKNWKWSLPSSLLLIALFTLLLSVNSGKDISDMAQAYTDNALYQKAIDQANTNSRVLDVFGKIESIDKLAILEGNTSYSNNNNSVRSSFRISGSKATGKLDLTAHKKGTEWVYKKITVRIKNPKEEIIILE